MPISCYVLCLFFPAGGFMHMIILDFNAFNTRIFTHTTSIHFPFPVAVRDRYCPKVYREWNMNSIQPFILDLNQNHTRDVHTGRQVLCIYNIELRTQILSFLYKKTKKCSHDVYKIGYMHIDLDRAGDINRATKERKPSGYQTGKTQEKTHTSLGTVQGKRCAMFKCRDHEQ